MNQLDALQAALRGEHAALYAIGVAGGRLRGKQFTAAQALDTAHRLRRDELAELITGAGQQPAAAEPAYDLPSPVANPTAAATLIRLVEQRLTAIYGELVEAAEDPAVRRLAIQALVSTASEQTRWGGQPTALPGD